MGYEGVETDSLITLRVVIGIYMSSVKSALNYQTWKDAKYEIDRIDSELDNR